MLPCLRRGDWLTRFLVRIAPGFTWRWGWTSAYDIEQRSFWSKLWPILRDEGYDILHVQDPLLADLCRRYREAGKLKTREILAHGTEEPVGFLSRFAYLQHLAPWHLEQVRTALPEKVTRHWTALPNFVDCEVFRPPVDQEEKARLRRTLGISEDAFVVISVAALKCGHKRVDYVIREFKAMAGADWVLVLAGAKTDETARLMELIGAGADGDIRPAPGCGILVLEDYSHEKMPDLLRAADVFVLASLFEMMPIALLEALASGLPVITNNHPVMAWMSGAGQPNLTTTHCAAPGGMVVDMSKPGALAEALTGLTPEWIREHGCQARQRAVTVFSTDVVIGQYVEYYRQVCGAGEEVVE